MGLINLDEFDKYAEKKMPLLKNLMQMSSLHVCKAYQRNFRDLPRIASFIGTSNRFDLMSDPTGSRRFFCVEVEKPIDCEGIEHEQIFAQLKRSGKFNRTMLPFIAPAQPKMYFSVVSAWMPRQKRNICNFPQPTFIKN